MHVRRKVLFARMTRTVTGKLSATLGVCALSSCWTTAYDLANRLDFDTEVKTCVVPAAGHQFIGAMLEAATPRLGGQCTQELAQLKKAFGMSLKAGDTFLMSTDGVLAGLFAMTGISRNHILRRGMMKCRRLLSCFGA